VKTRFRWGKAVGKKINWKRGVDGWIKLRLIFRKWDAEAWTGLIPAQDRDRWRDLVNAVP